MKVRAHLLSDKFLPHEILVGIDTAEGHTEQYLFWPGNLKDGYVEIGYPVADRLRDGHRELLVETSRESMAGYWRVWVPEDAVVESA